MAELGPRHLEILELVLAGCSNQEISTATGLSLGTIKNYVSTILLALDVQVALAPDQPVPLSVTFRLSPRPRCRTRTAGWRSPIDRRRAACAPRSSNAC